MSHLRILQDCIMEDVHSVMILEDDAETTEGFGVRVREFLSKVPDDWEGIMLGGQHHRPPTDTGISGVVRVQYAQRTHAYIARPSYMKALQQRWGQAPGHIDWRMEDWQHQYIVYGPHVWLVGQGGGFSDVYENQKPREWWTAGAADPADMRMPVVLLKAPCNVADGLQRLGWHGGHQRDRDTGCDVGLIQAMQYMQAAERRERLRRWIELIQNECRRQGGLCTVWHPQIDQDLLREVYDGPVVVVEADSVEAAEAQWRREACRLE